MMRALYTAATGMLAQQYNIDTISNNLANVNTTGFRSQLGAFPGFDLSGSCARPVRRSGLADRRRSRRRPRHQDRRLGKSSSRKACSSRPTTPLELAIEGDGFFQVTLPDGTSAYTRDGSFKKDSNGAIVTAGRLLPQPADHDPGQRRRKSPSGQDGTVTRSHRAARADATRPDHAGPISNPAGLSAGKGRTCIVQTLRRARRDLGPRTQRRRIGAGRLPRETPTSRS